MSSSEGETKPEEIKLGKVKVQIQIPSKKTIQAVLQQLLGIPIDLEVEVTQEGKEEEEKAEEKTEE